MVTSDHTHDKHRAWKGQQPPAQGVAARPGDLKPASAGERQRAGFNLPVLPWGPHWDPCPLWLPPAPLPGVLRCDSHRECFHPSPSPCLFCLWWTLRCGAVQGHPTTIPNRRTSGLFSCGAGLRALLTPCAPRALPTCTQVGRGLGKVAGHSCQPTLQGGPFIGPLGGGVWASGGVSPPYSGWGHGVQALTPLPWSPASAGRGGEGPQKYFQITGGKLFLSAGS